MPLRIERLRACVPFVVGEESFVGERVAALLGIPVLEVSDDVLRPAPKDTGGFLVAVDIVLAAYPEGGY